MSAPVRMSSITAARARAAASAGPVSRATAVTAARAAEVEHVGGRRLGRRRAEEHHRAERPAARDDRDLRDEAGRHLGGAPRRSR